MDDLISRKAAVAIADEARKIVAYELSCAGYDDAFAYASGDYMAKMAETAVNRHTAPAVKVNPLVWVDGDDDDSLVTVGSLCGYIIGYVAEDATCGLYMDDGCHLGNFPDEAAAKAAAQADYEASILAALEVSQ